MLLLLKKHSATLLSPIAHLVNLSIKTGEFPQNFKTAVVTPIFKSGDTDEVCNYIPISIVPVISKVLEKLVVEQLMNYLEKNHLLILNLSNLDFGQSTQQKWLYVILQKT